MTERIEIPIDRDAAYKHLWAVTMTWSLVACIYFGAGLVFLIWAWFNKGRMKRWCNGTKVEIAGDDLIIHRHSFIKSITHIPIGNIGFLTVVQSPYLRKYKICNIQIGGIGMGGNRAIHQVIPAVPEDKADDVIDLIKSHMPNTRSSERPDGVAEL